MSFRLERDKPTNFGRNYDGPVAVVEFEFSFVFLSGLFGGSAVDELELLVQAGIFSASIAPVIRNNLLGYLIWRDTAPRIDRYRVQVQVAGEADEASGEIGPFFNRVPSAGPRAIAIPLMLALVVAVGIAGIFAVIAWRIFNLGGAAFSFLVLGLAGIAAVGVLYVVSGNGDKKAVASGR